MENSVEVKITVDKKEAEKLADVAGGEEHVAEYLVRLIRKLYAEQRNLVSDLHFEQLVHEADLLIEQHQEYEAIIRKLQARLKKMILCYAKLMATVQMLDKDTPPAFRRPGGHQLM